ncbi:putative ran guanine nucleotide release factor [Camellia lanceoleosa]|uniref:Ran guanine nucleotide release factor n=1 Tax=Camellia lanceoleosa TaxID=1840588 RepID=A0ACC0F9I6_9ERIC|nr:putative ran guanine nucleotide release factor [Camellia lanceoleosa]
MAEDYHAERPLFGGAIASTFPLRFQTRPFTDELVLDLQDVSNIRQVPDHQSIFELLDLKLEVLDNGSATWFLQDLIIEQSAVIEADGLRFRNIPAVVTTAVGQMAISKECQGREAENTVRVYLANLRLKEVGTDVLITAYEPILISPLSESASAVGAGLAVPAAQSGCMPMAEVFKLAVSSFKVNDWSLFGAAAA